MGVGGLLKEIPARPQPREGRPPRRRGRPRVAAIVLAAGAARRMRGRDKLLEPVGGRPVLRAVAEAARASRPTRWWWCCRPERRRGGRRWRGWTSSVVEAPDWAEGMAASIRAGLAAVAGGRTRW